MKRLGLSVCALFAGCIVVAACSQAPGVSGFQYTPNIDTIRSQRDNPHHYTLLYAFGKAPDGSGPLASLIDRSGTLCGTTERGGTSGGGTVFSVTTAGAEKVLHSFDAERDGLYPASNLVDVDGLLSGTTSEGGAYGCPASVGQECGTVFSIATSGTEKVLYSFDFRDGAKPLAGLINVKGTLYDTTSAGGEYDCYPLTCGTVFSITTAGKEMVLHSFGKGRSRHGRGADSRLQAAPESRPSVIYTSTQTEMSTRRTPSGGSSARN